MPDESGTAPPEQSPEMRAALAALARLRETPPYDWRRPLVYGILAGLLAVLILIACGAVAIYLLPVYIDGVSRVTISVIAFSAGGGWFLLAIVAYVVLSGLWERSSEAAKVEREPIFVDVDEQEYRVRFVVRGRDEVATVDRRTPTGWQYLGTRTYAFHYGTYGRFDQHRYMNDRPALEQRARRVVEDVCK